MATIFKIVFKEKKYLLEKIQSKGGLWYEITAELQEINLHIGLFKLSLIINAIKSSAKSKNLHVAHMRKIKIYLNKYEELKKMYILFLIRSNKGSITKFRN